MKKILLLMAILMSFTFISCGDDKEKDEPVEEPVNLEQLVIGEWKAENGEYVYRYIFRSNYTGDYTQYGIVNGEIKFSRSYSWSLIGNTLNCISPFHEKLGTFTLSYENGTLHMVDTRGFTFTKTK